MDKSTVLLHESDIRGHHIHKRTYYPVIGKMLTVDHEYKNAHPFHAVGLLKEGTIIGHHWNVRDHQARAV